MRTLGCSEMNRKKICEKTFKRESHFQFQQHTFSLRYRRVEIGRECDERDCEGGRIFIKDDEKLKLLIHFNCGCKRARLPSSKNKVKINEKLN